MHDGNQPQSTDEAIAALRKRLNLPANINPTAAQLKEAGIELIRPPAPPAPPMPRIYDSVGGYVGEEKHGPDRVRVVLGDVKLTNSDLIRIASLCPALLAVVDERREQIEQHRHTQPLDMQYRDGELALAAMSYIVPYGGFSHWPWEISSFKPATPGNDPRSARIKNLIKGLALGLAELERLIAVKEKLSDR